MTPIEAVDALEQINTELHMALTNGALVVGQKVDAIDREHVEKASVIVRMLLDAQRKEPLTIAWKS
jgi:hypothetical protein